MVATVLENQTAAMLAIGTANPGNIVPQDEYPDWYLRVTKSDHLTKLKAKLKRIGEKSGVKAPFPSFGGDDRQPPGVPGPLSLPSLGARLDITEEALSKLATAAANKAIAEWGRPATDITHLILTTTSCASTPGPDLRLAALLGLRLTVRRTLLYFHGCSASCGALRLAKDIAENNHGARVLVACAEVTVIAFHAPDEDHHEEAMIKSLFGDGAGAVIVGAAPKIPIERPIFHMVSASQATLPRTEDAVWIKLSENGQHYYVSAGVPALVRDSIKGVLVEALEPLGLARGDGCNDLFWAVHPGGPAILESYRSALGLQPEKRAVSRHVLSEYGNMLGATIIFVLDELRRRRNGGDEDSEWGVMLGPGLTVETTVFHGAGNQEGETSSSSST